MDKIFNYFNWFNVSSETLQTLEISKNDIYEMKDADDSLNEKVQKHLEHTPAIVDRRTVMLYEKKFRDKFTKIGNLNQKCPYCSQSYKSLHVGEKKCLNCKKTFLVQKRVQDMGTVAFTQEAKERFETQWKAVSGVKKFKLYLQKEYVYLQKQLEKQGKRNLKHNDIMHAVIDAYAKNSLSVGYYQLYASFMFYKAELLRSEQRFAEALNYYFYVHFLHSNGVDNEANFGVNTVINEELKARISELFDLGELQSKKIQELFNYALLSLNRFSKEVLRVSVHKSYSQLIKEFKDFDAAKEGYKPMRSFVLYTKAS